MKIVWNVIGILCLPVGGVWFLQGIDVLRGSVMSGHRRWILVGGFLIVLGVVVLIVNNRRRRAS